LNKRSAYKCIISVANTVGKQVYLFTVCLPVKQVYSRTSSSLCKPDVSSFNGCMVLIGQPCCMFSGRTPLMVACIHYNLDIVRELLDANADIDYTDCHGDSALHLLLGYDKEPESYSNVRYMSQDFILYTLSVNIYTSYYILSQ